MKLPRAILVFLCAMLLADCATAPPYCYQYIAGKTAAVQNGQISLPDQAPQQVRAALAAGCAIQGKPYVYGGGHRRFEDAGYDCSGSVSYVLYHAGLLREPESSDELCCYGQSGPGKWITVYASRGHAFIVVAGVRLDTGYTGSPVSAGPRWTIQSRPAKGCVLRHPPGL